MKYIPLMGIIAGLMVATIGFAKNSDQIPTIYIKNKSERHLFITLTNKHGGPLFTNIHKGPGEDYVGHTNVINFGDITIKYCTADCSDTSAYKIYKAKFNNLSGDRIDKIYVKFTVDKDNTNPMLEPQKGTLNRTKVKEGDITHVFVSLKHNITENNIEQLEPKQ